VISEHTIMSYFAQAQHRGWGLLVRGSLARGWHAVYRGKQMEYDVYLDVDETWVYLQCPLLLAEPNEACKAALYEYLLRMNEHMFLAKLALTPITGEQGTVLGVVLIAECPADRLDAGLFRMLTDAISTYVEECDREIRNIGLNPEIAAIAHAKAQAQPVSHQGLKQISD
jgi:hypothetical protein